MHRAQAKGPEGLSAQRCQAACGQVAVEMELEATQRMVLLHTPGSKPQPAAAPGCASPAYRAGSYEAASGELSPQTVSPESPAGVAHPPIGPGLVAMSEQQRNEMVEALLARNARVLASLA